jgi:hypothetical protein
MSTKEPTLGVQGQSEIEGRDWVRMVADAGDREMLNVFTHTRQRLFGRNGWPPYQRLYDAFLALGTGEFKRPYLTSPIWATRANRLDVGRYDLSAARIAFSLARVSLYIAAFSLSGFLTGRVGRPYRPVVGA